MTPHQLQRHKLAQAFVRLLRRAHHCMQARRLREQLQHHTDQAAQMREWAQVSTTAAEWHTQQAAIAKASLRALGDLPSPLHWAASNDSSSNISSSSSATTVGAIDCDGPEWATPRLGAVIVLTSAGIVAAGLWHLAA